MTTAMLLGFVFAIGLILIGTGLRPAPVPLHRALAELHAPRATTVDPTPPSMMVRLVGRPLAHGALGRAIVEHWRQDLRIAQMSVEELIAKEVLVGLCGVLWAPALAALLALGGVQVPVAVPVWAALVLGLVSITVPVLELRARANRRRLAFRHAFGCFLDLVAVRLAGGAGVDSALNAAAAAGDGWAFTELRHALDEARLFGEPPWAGLDRLGTDLGTTELNELAASVTLAGDEGARVRNSITAKARALRTHGLADAETAAQSASERMSLPIVLLMVGFVAFLGYPAIAQVLRGL